MVTIGGQDCREAARRISEEDSKYWLLDIPDPMTVFLLWFFFYCMPVEGCYNS